MIDTTAAARPGSESAGMETIEQTARPRANVTSGREFVLIAALFFMICLCAGGLGYCFAEASLSWRALLFAAAGLLAFVALVSVWSRHTSRAEEAIAEAHEVRRTLEEELARAQRAGSVMALANRIVHDFNNLITVIDGYSEMALMTLDQNHSVYKAMQEIRRASARASDLLNQLLGMSQKHSYNPEPLNINSVIRQTKTLLEPLLGADIRLVLELSEGIRPVFADKRHIEQALVNLVLNVKASVPPGGRVTVATVNTSVSAEMARTMKTGKAGEYVRVDVSSRGAAGKEISSSEEETPALKEVESVAQRSSGFVHVDRDPREGVFYSLFFPRVQGMVHEEPLRAADVYRAGATETILLVEDDDAVRHLARKYLRDAGYTVLEAASAEEALMVYEGEAGKIDLLVTDIVLPGMSGFDLAKQARERFGDLGVIFISGHTERLAKLRELLGEGYEFLPKPFSSEGLLSKIDYLLHQRLPARRAANE